MPKNIWPEHRFAWSIVKEFGLYEKKTVVERVAVEVVVVQEEQL